MQEANEDKKEEEDKVVNDLFEPFNLNEDRSSGSNYLRRRHSVINERRTTLRNKASM